MKDEHLAELRRIVARLADQDSECTKHPMYAVFRIVRHGGMDPSLADYGNIMWVHEGEVCPESWWPVLNGAYECDLATVVIDGDEYRMSDFEQYGFSDESQIEQVCLTREGAERYLAADGHNLDCYGKPFIRVESFNRNGEMIAIREMLPAILSQIQAADALANDVKAAIKALGPVEDHDAIACAGILEAAMANYEAVRGG